MIPSNHQLKNNFEGDLVPLLEEKGWVGVFIASAV